MTDAIYELIQQRNRVLDERDQALAEVARLTRVVEAVKALADEYERRVVFHNVAVELRATFAADRDAGDLVEDLFAKGYRERLAHRGTEGDQ